MWWRASLVCVLSAWVAVFSLAQGQDKGQAETGYRVGTGDILEVKAFQHEEISGSFPVEEWLC